MKKLQKLNKLLSNPLIRLIRIYQMTLSPDQGIPSLRLKGRVCSHEPHCSKYSVEVLKKHGFWPGIWYASERVLHCTPSMTINHDPSHYRVVFCSSAPIGVPFLQQLHEDSRFEVVGVVTQPDKASGRGMEMHQNIIKTEAQKLGITDIQTPNKLNPEKSPEGKTFTEWLQEKQPDFLVVIAYGKILPEAILDIPTKGPINVHGSILPEYRGASPLQSVFFDNKSESGITIMKMDKEMDTGDMIDTLKTPLKFDRTVLDLINRIQTKGPKFLSTTLREYGKGHLGSIPQDHKKASYCTKIEKESGLFDPETATLQDIYNKYRAFFLWPKIYFEYKGKRVIIEELKIDENIYKTEHKKPIFEGSRLNSAITDIVVKPEGKKPMDWKSFCNGYIN
ncbi:MAG: methionyl-tRNA formyltransferase [Candidatus Absconditabacteria bacterium]